MIPRLVEPYAPLPPVIQRAEREEEPAPAQPAQAKKLLIVHSKDVSSEERKVFQFWGKVAVWDDRYVNIPLERLPESDYIFMDMRLKSARVALGSADLSHYAVVSYVPWYHKGEKFISQLESVALTKFPLRATSKADFEKQLLCEKVESPSIARTVESWLVQCLQ